MSDVKGTAAGFAEQNGRVVLIILAALHRKVGDRMHDCYEVAPGAPPSVIAAAGKLEVLDLSAADAHFLDSKKFMPCVVDKNSEPNELSRDGATQTP